MKPVVVLDNSKKVLVINFVEDAFNDMNFSSFSSLLIPTVAHHVLSITMHSRIIHALISNFIKLYEKARYILIGYSI